MEKELPENTTIQISRQTKVLLNEYRRGGETYEQLLNRMLSEGRLRKLVFEDEQKKENGGARTPPLNNNNESD